MARKPPPDSAMPMPGPSLPPSHWNVAASWATLTAELGLASSSMSASLKMYVQNATAIQQRVEKSCEVDRNRGEIPGMSGAPERDGIALQFSLSMMFAQTRFTFVARAHALISLFEHDLFGKPVPTFPDHALIRRLRDPASQGLDGIGRNW